MVALHTILLLNIAASAAAFTSPADALAMPAARPSSLTLGGSGAHHASLAVTSAPPSLGAATLFSPRIATSSSFRASSSRNGGLRSHYNVRGFTRLQSSATSSADSPFTATRRERIIFELRTLLRVLLPATLAGVAALFALPAICFRVANFVTRVTAPGKIPMLGDAVQSFISLVGLLYSILVGQVFGFLYSQQEQLYYALFDEVTEAKSLLEQVALVSQGRSMYSTCLNSIARYVRDDLLGGTLPHSETASTETKKSKAPPTPSASVTPSLILSARPADDPLEAILYLTSVGVPGQVYDTVRSLRQARARRLGALQRKVPAIHLVMLWILGLIMMASFPVLVGVGGAAAAGGQIYDQVFPWSGYKVWTLQGGLFGVATFAVVLTKMVLGELWREKGGAYNVDVVLRVMVRGLQKELDERMVEARKIMKRSKNKGKDGEEKKHGDHDIQRE